MVRLNISLLIEHYRLQIKLQVFVIFLILEISDYIVRWQEVYVHSVEETHPDLGLFLEDPQQLLVDLPLVLELGEQSHALLTILVFDCLG